MKRLIMCEGSNELTIVKILLEHNALIFGEDELLGLTPYHARQIVTSAQVRMALNMYHRRDIVIMRVGDKLADELKIPTEYTEYICNKEKYCTKPELEILLIISEGLLSEYEKTKSSVSAKSFAKAHIRLDRKRYDNTSRFYREYYGDNCSKLVDAIREYRRVRGSHGKDERYLAELLK